jgi:divalent metal cation (Fe/Co/Zn/Cd) transporter
MSAPPQLPTVLPLIQEPPPRLVAPERERLVRRAKVLAWVGVGWHGIEAAVAVLAGLAAGSVALVGFGADSLIEALAGCAVLWRFAGGRSQSDSAERRAQQIIAVSFYALAAYIGVESVRTLLSADHPQVSWAGIGLAAVTLAAMPPLAVAKARVGRRLGSAAAMSESRQNMLCAMLSAALLVGLGANAAFGWWWADPVAALVVAAAAVKEGVAGWRGDGCCTTAVTAGERCSDDCCAS